LLQADEREHGRALQTGRWIVAESFRIRAQAGVNLTDGPHDDGSTTPGTVVAASAAGAGSVAGASASATKLTATTHSENSTLTKAALATANLGVRYALSGGNGGAVPLRFNFGFSGTITAEAGPFPVGGAGSAHGGYSLETLDAKRQATARIAVGPKGPPLIATSGSFEKKGSLKIRVTPKVTVEVATFELIEQDFDELGIDLPPLDFDTTEFDVSTLAVLIEEAIGAVGLPRLGIAPGTTVGVSFDITLTIAMVDTLEVNVVQGGFLSAGIDAGSAAGALAKGEANFGGSLVLESVTFAGGGVDVPDDLRVVFDSGVSMKVSNYDARA
jgi:hypothetical protein